MKTSVILFCVALIMGSGIYQTARSQSPHADDSKDSNAQDVTSILERIRQDVGNYEYMAHQWRGVIQPRLADPAAPDASDAPAVCSLDNYDFDVTNVEVTLQAVTQKTYSGGLALKIPFGGAAIKSDGNSSLSSIMTNTIVLDRIPTNDPKQLQRYHDSSDYINLTKRDATHAGPPVFPITEAIIALRKTLIAAAGKYPCFNMPSEKSAGNVIKFEFEVDKALDADVGFDVHVVSAKVDGNAQNKKVNAIVVTLTPHFTVAAAGRTMKHE
jgi:hypothetical protein